MDYFLLQPQQKTMLQHKKERMVAEMPAGDCSGADACAGLRLMSGTAFFPGARSN